MPNPFALPKCREEMEALERQEQRYFAMGGAGRGGVILSKSESPHRPGGEEEWVGVDEELWRLKLSQAAEREAYLLSRIESLEGRLADVDSKWASDLLSRTEETDRLRAKCNELELALAMASGPVPAAKRPPCDLGIPMHLLSLGPHPPSCGGGCSCCAEVTELRAALRDARRVLRVPRGLGGSGSPLVHSPPPQQHFTP
eukprot:Hpha_TRINITY_DN15540_c1_g13::TRINITY_DN15540_c1_g13_i1::g.104316::m.104316